MPNAQKLVQHWDKLPFNFLWTFIQIIWKYLLVSGTFTIFTLAFDNYEYEKFFFQVNKITNDSVQNKQAYKNNFCCLKKQKFILKNTIYCRYVNQINFASVSALNKNAG